jgi:hypothetical protein
MTRVHVICEGQTEEMFVNEVMAGHLVHQGIYLIPSLVGKPGHKGGDLRFARLFTDVRARLLSDKSAYCTTLFDFYGLPTKFPGKAAAKRKRSHVDKAQCILEAITAELQTELGEQPLRRFIPYVQMYEFEGLLFSDTDGFAEAINEKALAGDFRAIREGFDTPEEINDNPQTAPSKRILSLFSGYEKPLYGSLAAIEIGLAEIRQQCPLFDGWVTRLQSLTGGTHP